MHTSHVCMQKCTQAHTIGVQIDSHGPLITLWPDCWQCSAMRTSGLLMKSAASDTHSPTHEWRDIHRTHTYAHQKKKRQKNSGAFFWPQAAQKNVMFHLLLSLGGEHGSAELHTHIQTFSTHSVSAIMSRVEREDLEHPHCAEGLFSRASRVCLLLLLITEQQHWRWLRPTYSYMHIHTLCSIYSSHQHRQGNTLGAACCIHTSSGWSHDYKGRPTFALRQEAVWHKMSPAGVLL